MRGAVLAAVALLTAGMLVAGKSDPLAGRRAGTPVRCVNLQLLNGPEIVDAQTILYRQSGKRIWKTGPVGECPSLRPLDTLIVEVYGGQLCRNDRFRTVSAGMSIPSGSCRFRDFTPYDKVK
ncbi:hypothetical protein [Sphingomonas sp. OK281]|uniref:hypothetical protein n=1 Tax=Sphingomonas sp. OK281 TaxID=1881067 RepID=UPI0008EF9414|nr:hypothetical protein [Sphingomonas sp. OK281]SFO08107.1 hypothetical protein SAMN05428984_2121 [Sphingomonas sp. OK281]